jgi:RNA polymerase sigma-70 factor (ECF subfamily)
MAEPTDFDIVKSCLDGNREDFAVLVDRYKGLVYSVISRMTCNPDDYADIAQEVFIKLYKNLDKYRPEYRFATWVIRVTTNHIIDLRRKKSIENTTVLVSIEDAEYNIGTSDSAEDEYLRSERMAELDGKINALPEIYRLPLVLYHRHGMSYADIAQSLGISLSKVKNRIFRARKMLKESLE